METKIDKKLESIDILKESANLICRNLKFVVFALFSSLPLFCFSVFFELSLQDTFSLASKILSQQTDPWTETDKAFVSKLIQICLLYLFPYHLLDLLTTTAIADAASTVYTLEEQQIGLCDLVRKSVQVPAKFPGCLITSLFVRMLSTSALLGFVWIAADSCFFLGIFQVHRVSDFLYVYDPASLLPLVLIVLLRGALFIVLMAKHSKWNAEWNLGLVVSALEDQSVCGSDALELSAYYIRGNERPGLWLMLAFFIHGLVLRLPCLFSKCSEKPNGVFYTCIYAGLICTGNVFKWVASVVYYHGCRSRVLEKKADEETGRRAKPVDA